MQINECMTQNVKLANPNMSLTEAAQKMRDGNLGSLPVGKDDRLVGMVTDRDIAIRGVAEGKDPQLTRISEVMSHGILYCYEDQSVEEVEQNMTDNQIRRIPVLNREKRLVGIFSLTDHPQRTGMI